MSLVPWDPFKELEDMSDRLNRIFARGGARNESGARGEMKTVDWAPLVDIKETPEAYMIRAELPAMKKEDVKVHINNGVLTLEGERKIEKEEKGKKYHRIERSYGTFMRSFSLPEDIDEARVSADYKDGVLDVHLPKAPNTKPRAVEVKVS